jgi:hypothetical protein
MQNIRPLFLLLLFLPAFPCHADTTIHPTSLEWDLLTKELEVTNKELENLNLRIEDMAKDIRELKECNAMARHSPMTLEQLREAVKPPSKADDSKLVDMFKEEMKARMKCGLPLN